MISLSIFYMQVLDQEPSQLLDFNQSQVQVGLFSSLFFTFWGFFADTFFVTWVSVSPSLSMHKKDWCRYLNLNLPAAGWDLSRDISRISINEMQPERGMWSRQFAPWTALCIKPFTSVIIWGAVSVWASPFCLSIKRSKFLWMETFNGMEMNSLFTLQSQIPDSLVRELSHKRHFLSLFSWLMSDLRGLWNCRVSYIYI